MAIFQIQLQALERHRNANRDWMAAQHANPTPNAQLDTETKRDLHI